MLRCACVWLHTGLPALGGGEEKDRGERVRGDVPLSDFGAPDREKVLELLLSQERVVSLLYTKTFPRPEDAGATLTSGSSVL